MKGRAKLTRKQLGRLRWQIEGAVLAECGWVALTIWRWMATRSYPRLFDGRRMRKCEHYTQAKMAQQAGRCERTVQRAIARLKTCKVNIALAGRRPQFVAALEVKRPTCWAFVRKECERPKSINAYYMHPRVCDTLKGSSAPPDGEDNFAGYKHPSYCQCKTCRPECWRGGRFRPPPEKSEGSGPVHCSDVQATLLARTPLWGSSERAPDGAPHQFGDP